MVNIDFTEHAVEQLSERKLSRKIVVEAVKNPDFSKKQTDGRLRIVKIYKKKPKLFLLIIITENSKSKITVVTAFVTSKVKKYL